MIYGVLPGSRPGKSEGPAILRREKRDGSASRHLQFDDRCEAQERFIGQDGSHTQTAACMVAEVGCQDSYARVAVCTQAGLPSVGHVVSKDTKQKLKYLRGNEYGMASNRHVN